MKQTTIKTDVEGVGIGLHKGEPIKIILEPLGSNSGIVFYRKDLGVSYKAEPKNVVNTQMATVIGGQEGYVSTVEHLLSAISGYGIDNIRIVLDANEVPVMDGSAISYCMMLDEAGIQELDEDKKVIVIKRKVEVSKNGKFAMVEPSRNPKFNFTIKFNHPIIGEQSYSFEFSKKNYVENIARARTFGFLKDVQMLRAQNLALGGSLDNAVVIDDNKILDAIGDLSLMGAPLMGDYTSFAGSHELNHELTKAILSDEKNYEIITLSEGELAREFQKVFA